jgi:hypothetical protein
MSKEQFEQASKNLYEKMQADGIVGILQYKPFSDEYWNEKIKVVFCNYEVIGFTDNEKLALLTYESFKGFISNKINSKTVRYTVVLANALLKMLNNYPSSDFSYKNMRDSYWQIDEIYGAIKNSMYMNLRPTGAKGNKQEINETHKIITAYKKEIRTYIEALDADIFVLSSKDSVGLFNVIFDDSNKPLAFKSSTRVNETIVFSVKHFSRFNYRNMYKKAQEICYYWFHI